MRSQRFCFLIYAVETRLNKHPTRPGKRDSDEFVMRNALVIQ